jgi:hypothetical protein
MGDTGISVWPRSSFTVHRFKIDEATSGLCAATPQKPLAEARG